VTLDTEGVLRSFSFKNQQWTPVLDFKIKHSEIYDKLWITGITDGEVLAIEMASSQQAVPMLTQKAMIRRFKLKVPLLNQDIQEGTKDGLPQFEEQLLRSSMQLEHNQFRKDNWEQLKHFRSKFDNEYCLSESVPDGREMAAQKKELDKYCLNAIRLCIVNSDYEKVFGYMDMMHFTQSLKLVVRLCEQLKVPILAQRVSKYLQEKETKEIF
jgi:hypothetical protein